MIKYFFCVVESYQTIVNEHGSFRHWLPGLIRFLIELRDHCHIHSDPDGLLYVDFIKVSTKF